MPDPYAGFEVVEEAPEAPVSPAQEDPYAGFDVVAEAPAEPGQDDPYAGFEVVSEGPGRDWSAREVPSELAKGVGSGYIKTGASVWEGAGVGLQGLAKLGRNIRTNLREKWFGLQEALGIEPPEVKPENATIAPYSSVGTKIAKFGEGLEKVGETGMSEADRGILTPTENIQNKPLARAARGVGAMVPALAGAAVTKNPQVALGAFALPAAGEKIYDARQMGASEADALASGAASGMGAYVFGRIPMGTIEGKLANLAKANFNVRDTLAKVGAKKLLDYTTAAAVQGGANGVQRVYENAVAQGYDGDRSLFEGALDSVADGVLMGLTFKGVHGIRSKSLARMETVRKNLAKDFGAENVKEFGETGFEVNNNGTRRIVQFVESAEDLGPRDVAALADSARAKYPKLWAKALEDAYGNEAQANQTLADLMSPPAATRENLTVTDPATGASVNADVWIGLVAGRATAGQVSHEALHSLATMSGLRTEAGGLRDPVSGETMSEEAVATALERGVDSPIARRLRDAAMGIVRLFRQGAETPFQTATRVYKSTREAARQKGEADQADAGEARKADEAWQVARQRETRPADVNLPAESFLPDMGERAAPERPKVAAVDRGQTEAEKTLAIIERIMARENDLPADDGGLKAAEKGLPDAEAVDSMPLEADIPKALTVKRRAMVEGSTETVEFQQSAREAVRDLQEQRSRLKALVECLS